MVAKILGEALTVLALRSIGDGDGASEVRHEAAWQWSARQSERTG